MSVRIERKLVGRDAEVALFADSVERLRRGRGWVALIEGEPGSGKTALADEAARLASSMALHRASGHEIDRERPLGLLAGALGISIASKEVEKRELARLIHASAGEENGALRFRIVDEAIAIVEREALAGPVLVALDDLQWADELSLLAVNHLARLAAHLPIGLLLARREVRWTGTDPVRAVLANPSASVIRLGPLGDDHVAALAQVVLGQEPGAALQRVLARAGGNPFFVIELLSALLQDRSINRLEIDENVFASAGGPDLRLVLLRRLGGLPKQTVGLLRVAAVLGSRFTVQKLAAASNAVLADVVEQLEPALAEGVLRPDGDALAFRHDLIGDALYTDMPAAIRNALHLQVAAGLMGAGVPPTAAAPHFALGAPVGDRDAVACLRAAGRAVADTEPAAARRWLSRALEICVDDTERDEISLELATVLNRVGDFKKAEETAAEALRPNASRGPLPVALRVALRRTLAEAMDHQDRCLEAAAVSDAEAHAPDLNRIEHARFVAEALERRTHVGDPSAEAEARALLVEYEALGDHGALFMLLTALHQAAAWRGDFGAALDFAERMADTVRGASSDSVDGRLLAAALARVGEIARARALLLEEVSAAESQRDPRHLSFVLTELALLDVQAARWDEAISNAEAAASVADELRQDTRYNEAVALLATLAIRRGDMDRAASLIETPRGARPWATAPARARLFDATGKHEIARDIIKSLWEEASQTRRRRDLLGYATDLVRLSMGAGDERAADEVIEALEGMAATAGPPVRGVAALCAGIRKGDSERLKEAARIAGDGGLLDLQASAREAAGAELARRGEREAAVAQLREAAEYYRSVSAELDVRRTEAALRALGVRVGATGRRPRQKSGWQSLSDTEVRVAQLASEGLTNAEIGARLFISGRTVERHLTHVYSKLGLESRIELTRLVART